MAGTLTRETAEPSTRPVRLLIVDDHEVVVAGLHRQFAADWRYDVVGVAGTGKAAIARATKLRPDVVLLDLRLPDMPGHEVCRAIRATCPTSAVVVLASDPGEQAIRQCLEAGAHAYVAKGEGLGALREVVDQVGSTSPGSLGQEQIAASLRKAIATDAPCAARVTPQQQRVLALIGDGLTNKEIAARLFVSESTVRFHTQNLKAEFDAHTRAALVLSAIRAGVLSTTPAGE